MCENQRAAGTPVSRSAASSTCAVSVRSVSTASGPAARSSLTDHPLHNSRITHCGLKAENRGGLRERARETGSAQQSHAEKLSTPASLVEERKLFILGAFFRLIHILSYLIMRVLCVLFIIICFTTFFTFKYNSITTK